MNKPIYERGRTSACFHLLPVIALEDMSSGFVTGQIVPVKSRSDRNAAVFAVCGHPAKARSEASDRMAQNMCCCGQNSHGINRKKYLRSGKNDGNLQKYARAVKTDSLMSEDLTAMSLKYVDAARSPHLTKQKMAA